MKGINEIMKKAQKMQEDIKTAQEEISNIEVVGDAGAGMVKVTMTGQYDVKSVFIDPSLMNECKSFLEDLISSAVNDAVKKAETVKNDKMSSLTGGIKIPDGFKMPF